MKCQSSLGKIILSLKSYRHTSKDIWRNQSALNGHWFMLSQSMSNMFSIYIYIGVENKTWLFATLFCYVFLNMRIENCYVSLCLHMCNYSQVHYGYVCTSPCLGHNRDSWRHFHPVSNTYDCPPLLNRYLRPTLLVPYCLSCQDGLWYRRWQSLVYTRRFSTDSFQRLRIINTTWNCLDTFIGSTVSN